MTSTVNPVMLLSLKEWFMEYGWIIFSVVFLIGILIGVYIGICITEVLNEKRIN